MINTKTYLVYIPMFTNNFWSYVFAVAPGNNIIKFLAS